MLSNIGDIDEDLHRYVLGKHEWISLQRRSSYRRRAPTLSKTGFPHATHNTMDKSFHGGIVLYERVAIYRTRIFSKCADETAQTAQKAQTAHGYKWHKVTTGTNLDTYLDTNGTNDTNSTENVPAHFCVDAKKCCRQPINFNQSC